MTFIELSQFVVNIKSGKKYDIYIGRPSKWGNPFSHSDGTLAKFKTETKNESLEKFRQYIMNDPVLLKAVKEELRGKVLGCFCYPAMCHGFILAQIANE